MLNRYYAVGERIYDQEYGIFSGKSLRNLTKEELEQESFFKKPTIRIFKTLEEAKQYVDFLQQSALECAPYAKNTNIKWVSPIFSIDLNPNFALGDLRVDPGLELPLFYLIKSNDIDKANIIKAEFHNSALRAVEFKSPVQNQTCAIV